MKLDGIRGTGKESKKAYKNTTDEIPGTRNDVVRQFHSNVRVLGIDPGFDRLGLAVIEGDASKPTFVWSDCVSPPAGTPSERLATIYTAVSDALKTYRPRVLSIETLFFSTNKKTALAVAEARGAVLSAAGICGVPVVEFSPGQVKLAVTGHGSADKKAIARMIPHLIELPVKKRLDDELDAIAVAIAGLTLRYPQR